MATRLKLSRRSVVYLVAALVLLAGLAWILWPSDDKGIPVSGEVTVDGEPVQHGRISFQPTTMGPRAGGTIEQGKYTVYIAAGTAAWPVQCNVTISTGVVPKPMPGNFRTTPPTPPRTFKFTDINIYENKSNDFTCTTENEQNLQN